MIRERKRCSACVCPWYSGTVHRVRTNSGFTIVELLIVVVVIAILAAITIVAYNGVTNQAGNSALKSEVSQFTKKVEVIKASTGAYPSDLAASGLTDGTGTVSYVYDPVNLAYCVQSKKGNLVYYATSLDTTLRQGECVNDPVGMVGWWKFNNNTTDSSPSPFTSTPTALTNATGQGGASNTAYSFDGSTSNLQVPYNASLSTSVQTVSIWIYPTSQTTNILYVSKRTAISNSWQLSYLGATSGVSYDCGGSTARYTTGYIPALNTWTNLVASCTSGGLISIYANGVKLGTTTVTPTNLATANGSLYIGRDSSAAQYYFNGRMDDVRLYSRVLTDEEVMTIYNSGAY